MFQLQVCQNGSCSPLSKSGKGNHVVRRLNLDSFHTNDTEGSWHSAKKIAPHQLNNQQNEWPTQNPLCTAMNCSNVREFGTADFIVLSSSLENTYCLNLQGYELIHGLQSPEVKA